MDDYNKVKLGLIGRFKVWREKREARKFREWYDSMNHEVTAVDYSSAEKLEAELLAEKRLKKATKDAKRIYYSIIKEDPRALDGLGCLEFVDNYLVEKGLKEKNNTNNESNEKNGNDFMSMYSTVRTPEQIEQDKKAVEWRAANPKVNDTMGLRK